MLIFFLWQRNYLQGITNISADVNNQCNQVVDSLKLVEYNSWYFSLVLKQHCNAKDLSSP